MAAAAVMGDHMDHYVVLGLPSGAEGARLSEQEITKAYRSKARALHPDKRRDEPNAHADFLKLQTSYQVLKDEEKRKLFDKNLLLKRSRDQIKLHQGSKRRKMMSDLEERELSSTNFDVKARDREEEVISRKLKEEIASIVAMHLNKSKQEDRTAAASRGKADSVDEGKFVKVNLPRKIGGYQAFEDSVLEKLKRAAQRQK